MMSIAERPLLILVAGSTCTDWTGGCVNGSNCVQYCCCFFSNPNRSDQIRMFILLFPLVARTSGNFG